jgi:hypothetical protein
LAIEQAHWPIAAMYGMFRNWGGESWTAELLDEHRREQERDEVRRVLSGFPP